ncbi:MAG: alpha-L-fucosidase [Chlorobi bacterium]|nr:alpha-L-fucosidase [Chlorobiota bacterium]
MLIKYIVITSKHHDGKHGFNEKTGTVNLTKDLASFCVDYFEATGVEGIRLKVKTPGKGEYLHKRTVDHSLII